MGATMSRGEAASSRARHGRGGVKRGRNWSLVLAMGSHWWPCQGAVRVDSRGEIEHRSINALEFSCKRKERKVFGRSSEIEEVSSGKEK